MLKLFSPNPPQKWSDEELVAKYVSSDEARYLGILYERYMPMVFGVCLKILKDRGKSEDAVMAIYEELTRKVKIHQIEAFRGWLYVLARNHCLMEWRKAQNRKTDLHASDEMHLFDAVEAPFDIEINTGKAPLQQCLEALPPQQNLCVCQFYFEDKSYKEISDLLGEEIGKVRSYIQNGRRNLKLCLENRS